MFEQQKLNILIPLVILTLLILLICSNFNENFILPFGAKSQVPNITNLSLNQLDSNESSNNLKNEKTNENPDNLELAPNYNLKQAKVERLKPGSILRQKTGRQAYEIEQFVNKYDSNFGGLLGTQMGLNP